MSKPNQTPTFLPHPQMGALIPVNRAARRQCKAMGDDTAWPVMVKPHYGTWPPRPSIAMIKRTAKQENLHAKSKKVKKNKRSSMGGA